MTKRELFIEFIENCIRNATFEGWSEDYTDSKWDDAIAFWEEFKAGKVKNSKPITENGKKVLNFMQENDKGETMFTAREIAEGLFTSGKSVAGTMKKLVSDGLVEKIDANPKQYTLTAAGREYKVEN